MIKLVRTHRYYYSEEETLHVLGDINLQVDVGEFLAVMGPSGSEKLTLINLLSFTDRKFEGTYSSENHETGDSSGKEPPRIRNETIGFVFWNFSLVEALTVERNIELPPLYNGLTPKRAKDRVHKVLTKVDLSDKGRKHPKQLSGGQQQRVVIVRATVNRSSPTTADEPTGALDSKTSEEVLTLFQQLSDEDVIIILVTHDEETIEYRNRLIKVHDGKILEKILI